MYLKIHEDEHNKVVAICDEDLIGKKLENQNLTIEITERFYKGESINNKKVKEILRKANNINLSGKESVTCAIEEDLIKSEEIVWFKDTPNAIITIIEDDE